MDRFFNWLLGRKPEVNTTYRMNLWFDNKQPWTIVITEDDLVDGKIRLRFKNLSDSHMTYREFHSHFYKVKKDDSNPRDSH